MNGILFYVEDFCGVENGLLGREVLVEFRKVIGLLIVINMVVIDWW